ncbi:MAG: LacI family DNA-binding transcriptional regulator [Lentisphaeria bacterium]|nr:LacI family DNA-binding transcriptional regulator [Lentisphaeria bacterium]
MRVTIKEVAAEAGVSYQVVSAILGNCSYARASETTRRKVREAAARLGYAPNISARILQGRSSGMIGVLIDPLAAPNKFNVLFKLERAAVRRNCRLLVSEAHDNPGRLKEACREMCQYGVDGIIALAHSYPGTGSLLDDFDEKVPVVPVWDILPGNYSAVVNDTAAGVAAAVIHLQHSGYKHIVMLTSNKLAYPGTLQRITGFRKVLPDNRIYSYDTSDDQDLKCELAAVVKKILSDGADAIVCYNDFTAAAVIRELRRNKVRVPEDMGITGFDDSPFCTVLDPALTSVAPDSEVVAENAFKLLEQRMAGNRKNVYITVPPKLKIRESSVR